MPSTSGTTLFQRCDVGALGPTCPRRISRGRRWLPHPTLWLAAQAHEGLQAGQNVLEQPYIGQVSGEHSQSPGLLMLRVSGVKLLEDPG